MKLVDRDYKILFEVGRWRFLLGRHIKDLCSFSSSSSCDKRLKQLIEADYLERKKIIYGVPGLYTLTHKGRILMGFNKRAENIRLEKVNHDINVVECAIYLIRKFKITTENIVTEKELHSKDGFGISKHYPDFIVNLVINHENKTCAVEIEMTLKKSDRIENNIKSNYLAYDYQMWFIPRGQKKVIDIVTSNMNKYSDVSIHYLEEVKAKNEN